MICVPQVGADLVARWPGLVRPMVSGRSRCAAAGTGQRGRDLDGEMGSTYRAWAVLRRRRRRPPGLGVSLRVRLLG